MLFGQLKIQKSPDVVDQIVTKVNDKVGMMIGCRGSCCCSSQSRTKKTSRFPIAGQRVMVSRKSNHTVLTLALIQLVEEISEAKVRRRTQKDLVADQHQIQEPKT